MLEQSTSLGIGLTSPTDDHESEDINRRLTAFESIHANQYSIMKEPSKDMAMLAARTLLELLDFDSANTSNDTAFHLRMGHSLEESSKARGAAMVANERFRAFMSDELASSSLLVNGHADLASAEGISPLSFVSAELVRITEDTGRGFVAKFFCDRHPVRYGESFPPSLPRGLMASLVGQLVSQMLDKGVDINLSFLSQGDWRDIQSLRLSTLCSVFCKLAKQLPSKSLLLCVVDEITRYETMALANEIDLVMRKLTRSVRRHENMTFKLLVTSHSQALRVSKHFTGSTLDLPEDIEADDSSAKQMTTIGF